MADVRKEIKRLGIKASRSDVYAATMALREAGAEAVAPLIEVLLNDKEKPIVRCRAADALAIINDHRAVEPLIRTLSDNDVHLRWSVIGALGKIGDTRSLPYLEHIAANDNGEFSPMPNWTLTVKKAAEDAMKKLSAKQS
jgi:HEAT repeat protein